MSTDTFAAWPNTTTGTADQLARYNTVFALHSYGRTQADGIKRDRRMAMGSNLVHAHSIAYLLREWAKTDPERADKATRELLEAYEMAPAQLWDVTAWAAEYGMDSGAIVAAGTAEEPARTPLTADTDA